jgi:hypothetical protein
MTAVTRKPATMQVTWQSFSGLNEVCSQLGCVTGSALFLRKMSRASSTGRGTQDMGFFHREKDMRHRHLLENNADLYF